MLVSNDFKIYINKPIIKYPGKREKLACDENLKYKGEISNICYRPIFCGKDEKPDDYSERYDEVFRKIYGDNQYDVVQVASMYPNGLINRDNIDIAEELFSMQFCKEYLLSLLSNINEQTRPFAQEMLKDAYLKEHIARTFLSDINNEEYLQAICHLSEYKLSNDEDFPEKYAELLGDKLEKDDIKTLRRTFYNDYIDNEAKRKIFWEINRYNIPVLKHFLEKPRYFEAVDVAGLLSHIDSRNSDFAKEIITDKKYSYGAIDFILEKTLESDELRQLTEKLYYNKDFSPKLLKDLSADTNLNINEKKLIADSDIKAAQRKIKHQYKLIQKNPEKYISGLKQEDILDEISNLLENNNVYMSSLVLGCIFDKETLDVLFRKRSNTVANYNTILSSFSYDELKMLKQSVKLLNTREKPLTPAQKIELIDIIASYKKCELPLDCLAEMISKGKINIPKLKNNLTKFVLKLADADENLLKTASAENIASWNNEYLHLLAKTVTNVHPFDKVFFSEIIDFTLSNKTFKEQIHDSDNIYGTTNLMTKELFEKAGMDYESWLNPPASLNTIFESNNENMDGLKQTAEQLTEDIETLRNTPAKTYIDKQYQKYIIDDKFVIPDRIANSRYRLMQFINSLIKQLNRVWKHAEQNINNPEKANNARNTLMIHNHLKQRLDDMEKLDSNQVTKPLNLTIKMWDRIPQKDMFQGNYSTCCIGMGESTSHAMPRYLLNTAFNMIEIVDNNTHKTVGNALCYFVADDNGDKALIIDNIEIRNNMKPSNEISVGLRDAIAEYASNVAQKVTGNSDTSVYLGTRYNDVYCGDMQPVEQKMKLIGEIASEDIYLDAFGGWNAGGIFGGNVDGWRSAAGGVKDIARIYKLRH